MRKTTLGPSRKPIRRDIPEGPINDLVKIIDKTPADEWEKRTEAFESLVSSIPTGSDYYSQEGWFNSPPILRHLAFPLTDLLTDARSTVVKRTCEAAAVLFDKCQGDARYLLKDIMPAVMTVHGQTVQVIRSYVQNMISEALGVVPCKMAMPIWMDRLKTEKSITVREACTLYLRIGLQEWTEEGYLSNEVYNQVGSALVKAMRDQAPTVRSNAKKALEVLNSIQPDVFEKLANDREIASDTRIRKQLKRIQTGEDDGSVASSRMGSVRSGMYRSTGGSVASGRFRNSRSPSYQQQQQFNIPKTIGVTTPSRKPMNGGRQKPPSKMAAGLGPPVRMTAPFHSVTNDDDDEYDEPNSDDDLFNSPPPNGSPNHHNINKSNNNDTSFQSEEDTAEDLPIIANVNDLRKTARLRSSKTGSLLQRRFSKSSILEEQVGSPKPKQQPPTPSDDSNFLNELLDGEQDLDYSNTETNHDDGDDDDDKNNSDEPMPEHLKIAHELLESHKQHVDHIMETLKVEMDALRDFETLLLEGRADETEVLQYFESVVLCLEARTKAGTMLQQKMDKISQGPS
eukprot:scaffold4445_cov132-Cylindrotheca_fusiformis.AAC.5